MYAVLDVAALVQRDELEVEGELRVWWDAGQLLASVGVLCWHNDASLRTDTHALDTDVPALDDIAVTELELERLALGVGYRSVLALW